MKRTTFLILVSFFVSNIIGQELIVQPYLQDVGPHHAYIMWETTSGEESMVEWGLTDTLGQWSTGTAETSSGSNQIHTVKLEELARFTSYYYRVWTDSTSSGINRFKTTPFASDGRSFNLVAMSDMQRDGNHPDKFREVVEDGILTFLDEELGGDLIDNLALVMIPGDLVTNGSTYTQWQDQFFEPAKHLFGQVPVFPVLGNHENNSAFYFQYFHLPENGTEGSLEHWYYKDYGNVRIIGLNSNSPFNNQTQLDWLDTVLLQTCSMDSIDFVFAQLHHPHKSELWTPGESNYTGEVIERLEAFSTDCGKPSIHFFGHTHGYSRGDSRDHKHLWINVASAGGAIDNWGEFPNFDYDEFSVSQDEYGFVMVEFSAEANPKLTIRRISRGNNIIPRDNEIRDSLVIRKEHEHLNSPEPIFPVDERVDPECFFLSATSFRSGASGSQHSQSHWQISDINDDFSKPVWDSWRHYQNWYDDQDTQANDDLTNEKITGLKAETSYWWRVRYRDRELNWSEWSNAAMFTTSENSSSENLLSNPGSEDQLIGWTITQGVVESQDAGTCDGISPNSGARYFAVGGICDHSDVGICHQSIDISSKADSIDAGELYVYWGGYLSNYSGQDRPEFRLKFIDSDSLILEESETLTSLSSSWAKLESNQVVPPFTRSVVVELMGTRNSGTDNDSYFDDLFIKISTKRNPCDDVSTAVGSDTNLLYDYESSPNPAQDYVKIFCGKEASNLKIRVFDLSGQEISCTQSTIAKQVRISISHLSPATYNVEISEHGRRIGTTSFIKI